MTTIHFTVFTAPKNWNVGNKYSIGTDGKIEKDSNPFVKGRAEHVAIQFNDLPARLDGLKPNQCVGWGTFKGTKPGDVVKIDSRKAIANRDSANPDRNKPVADAEAIERNDKTFELSEGPGVLEVDCDGPTYENAIGPTPSELHNYISQHIPGFADGPVISRRSASARVHRSGGVPPRVYKFRLYVLLERGNNAPDMIDKIAELPGLEGIKIDTGPVTPSGVDYAGPPTVGEGLQVCAALEPCQTHILGLKPQGEAPRPVPPVPRKEKAPQLSPQGSNLDSTDVNISHLADALQAIPPELMEERKFRWKIRTSLIPLDEEGWELYNEFGKRWTDYDEEKNRKKWDKETANCEGRFPKAIFNLAKEHGWKNPGYDSAETSFRVDLDSIARNAASASTQPATAQAGTSSPASPAATPSPAQASTAAPSAPPAPMFNLLTPADLDELPPLEWMVDGLIPTKGIGVIHGASGAGKSFVALDLVAAISEGRKWFDRTTKQTSILYVALEGESGMQGRKKALEQKLARKLNPAFVRFLLGGFKLTDSKHLDGLCKQVAGTGCMIVIDTLNRAAPDSDENKSSDMGKIIDAAKKLADASGGVVTLIAHAGKDSEKGIRGHSSLFAALDFNLRVDVDKQTGARSIVADKVKDDATGVQIGFLLDVVQIGTRADGKAITSCVINPAFQSASHAPQANNSHKLPPEPTEGETAAFQAYLNAEKILRECERANGVHANDWKEHFYKIYKGESKDAQRMAFSRARKALCAKGRIHHRDNYYRQTPFEAPGGPISHESGGPLAPVPSADLWQPQPTQVSFQAQQHH